MKVDLLAGFWGVVKLEVDEDNIIKKIAEGEAHGYVELFGVVLEEAVVIHHPVRVLLWAFRGVSLAKIIFFVLPWIKNGFVGKHQHDESVC